ncbi:MAG: alpha/beta hydrolase [Pseudomonadota bacterium]
MNHDNTTEPDVEAPVRRLDAEARRFESPCGEGSMVWRSWGAGRALVLLHGGAGSWRHWVHTVPAFSAAYLVVAPDLPGLGESADPPASSDMATIAAIVAAGIDKLLGPQTSYDLVGFSFGASVGGHVSLLHGERVRSLTLLGAGGLVRPRIPMTLERVRDKTGEARVQAHRTNLQRTIIADPARIDALALAIQEWNVTHTRLDTPALIKLRPLAVSLPQLRIPVNAIWGERDQIAYYTLDDRIAELRVLRPGTEPRIIPSAGHWTSYEAPDVFNATLADLLDVTARTSAGTSRATDS